VGSELVPPEASICCVLTRNNPIVVSAVNNPMSSPGISLIICTFNNSALLDCTLHALARQIVSPEFRWEVVVVDNNCTDDSREVISRHSRAGMLPNVRMVSEPVQGLTHARRRGVESTASDWIAFVDDDCIVDRDWVESALRFAYQHPRCGALGGSVTLEWERSSEALPKNYGWLLAQQDYGEVPRSVEFLVGAGVAIRRAALVETGWIERPLLDDRVGAELISGGDMEIALRIRSRGWELWFTPACRLQHRIPSWRTKPDYLQRIAFSLGKSQMAVDALTFPGETSRYFMAAFAKATGLSLRALRRILHDAVRRRQFLHAAIDVSFARGAWAGIASVARLSRGHRDKLMGAARMGYQDTVPH
jgi:glycosyltransferase involved in cell wall biosynthesis